jgi:hypothetical protein
VTPEPTGGFSEPGVHNERAVALDEVAGRIRAIDPDAICAVPACSIVNSLIHTLKIVENGPGNFCEGGVVIYSKIDGEPGG